MKKNIVCFGDSNTHGYNAENGPRFGENQRWPQLHQKHLHDQAIIIEEGLSGRTTCFDDPITEGLNALDYISPCLMSHEPISLLIIMLGTNDTKARFNASAGVIAKGLERLILKAKNTPCWQTTPNILIITPKAIEKDYESTIVVQTMGLGCSEKSVELSQAFKEVAQLHQCHYIDANNFVQNYNKVDFMHLDSEGHKKMAESLLPTILELIE